MITMEPQPKRVSDQAESAHIPVLMNEVLASFDLAAGTSVLDCTCGFGGHSQALLQRGADVLGVDRDEDARTAAAARLQAHGDRFSLVSGCFGDLCRDWHAEATRSFDFILADIGVSSFQLDDEGRGFGIRSNDRLDMRMGDGCDMDACELIDSLSQDDLADVIYQFGEERRSRRIAAVLKKARGEQVEAASEFADRIRAAVPGHHKRHPALRTFQALRIAVNDELGQLDLLLNHAPHLLNPGGVLCIISFHSLEDRRVKNAFRDLQRDGIFCDRSKKVITASAVEQAENRRSHSAKLRWAKKSPAETKGA